MMFSFFKNLFQQGNVKQLNKILAEGAFLVDVRTPAEFLNGSVNGATNIPLSNITKQINFFSNKKNIVVFCKSGSRSIIAKAILKKYGFTNVINGGTFTKVNKLLSKL